MKNGINIVGEKNIVEATSDKLTEFIGECGNSPDYIVMSLKQAEWCEENVVGKKIKIKEGRVLKFNGLSVITV
jgi:hypothetical protein